MLEKHSKIVKLQCIVNCKSIFPNLCPKVCLVTSVQTCQSKKLQTFFEFILSLIYDDLASVFHNFILQQLYLIWLTHTAYMLNTDIRTINSNRNQTRPKTSTKKESHLCRKKQNIVENPRQFFSISAWTEHWRTPANNNGGRGKKYC